MESSAYGFIETYGLVAAIEATDAALKAANVRLYAFRYTTGGLVTTIVTGDVGAVKAAVDAGVMAAKRVGKVVAMNVIPRMDKGSLVIIDGKVATKKEDTGEKIALQDIQRAEQDFQKTEQIEEKGSEESPDQGMIGEVGCSESSKNQTFESETMEETRESKEGEKEENKNIQGDESTKKQEKEELEEITARIKELITEERLRKVVEQAESIDKISSKDLKEIARELLGEEVHGKKILSMKKAEVLELLIKFVRGGGKET